MTDRTVKVTLLAQATGLISGLRESRREARETGSELEKLAQKRESFERLGRYALAFGTAAALGIGMAVSSFADFDQQISYVQASTHESASNMGLLRDAALEAGAATVFSATESAEAIDELAKSGMRTQDILSGGLRGSLDLAAAGGLGVARAAEIASTTLQQYSLDGTKASHVSDVLAAGAGKAMGSVDDLAQGLKFVGPVAASMGISLEQTTGVLALFAQQGITGEQAGTSLRGVLSSLTAPSAQARKEIDRLGITLYDSNGKFLGLENAAGQLSKAYSTMDDASRDASLGIIFGRETITAATALYQAGAEGVSEWTSAVDDSGYAAETARIRLDNLKGDWEQLTGAIETGFIKTGSAANDLLRFLTQTATNSADAFSGMPAPLQATALGLAAVASGTSLAYGAFLVGVPKVAEFNAALDSMPMGVQRASRVLGGLAKAAAAIGVLGAAGSVIQELVNSTQGLSSSDEEIRNTVTTVSDLSTMLAKLSSYNDGTRSAIDNIDDLGAAIEKAQGRDTRGWEFWADISAGFTLQGADLQVNRLRDTFEALGSELANMVNADDLGTVQEKLRQLKTEGKLTDDQLSMLIETSPDLSAALTKVASDQGVTADEAVRLAVGLGEGKWAAKDAAQGLQQVASVSEVASDNFDALVDSIRDYGAATSELISANSDLYQSIDDAKAAWGAEGFQATLDLTTQAGRDNMNMLLGLADAANNAAAETYENTNSQDQLIGKLNEGRQALYDQARQFFDSDQAAWDYVNSLMQTPEQITTQVNLNGVDEAQAAIDAFVAQYQGKTITMQMFLQSSGGDAGLAASAARYTAQAQQYYEDHPNANGGLYAYANGGFGSGIYAGRAGAIYKMAEPETRWEAFISGKPGQERRNIGIWAEAGRRLGAVQTAPMQYATAAGAGGSGDGFTYNQTIIAQPGVSPEVIGKSSAAYATRKRRRSFG